MTFLFFPSGSRSLRVALEPFTTGLARFLGPPFSSDGNSAARGSRILYDSLGMGPLVFLGSRLQTSDIHPPGNAAARLGSGLLPGHRTTWGRTVARRKGGARSRLWVAPAGHLAYVHSGSRPSRVAG